MEGWEAVNIIITYIIGCAAGFYAGWFWKSLDTLQKLEAKKIRPQQADAIAIQSRATPPGFERVPEGTMLVIEKTAETIRGLMAAFAKSSEGIECRREIALHGENLGGIRALCEEILKAHRATQKDKEPT